MDFNFPNIPLISGISGITGNTGATGATGALAPVAPVKVLTVKDYQDALSNPESDLSIVDYVLLREASKQLSYREFISNPWVQKYVDIPRVARHNNLFWETVELLGWSREKVIPLVMKEEIELYLQNKILSMNETILVIKHHQNLRLKMLRQLRTVDPLLLCVNLRYPLSEEEINECVRLGLIGIRRYIPFFCDRNHFILTGALRTEDVKTQVINIYNHAIENLKITPDEDDYDGDEVLDFLLSQTTKIPRPYWWTNSQRYLDLGTVNKIEKLFL